MFLPYLREIIISATFILSSTNAFNLYQSKFFPFGKDLRIYFERLSCCSLTLDHTFPTFNDLRKNPFENIEGEEENAGSLAFSPFPAMFSSLPYTISIFESHLLCRLHFLSIWTGLKFCRVVKG